MKIILLIFFFILVNLVYSQDLRPYNKQKSYYIGYDKSKYVGYYMKIKKLMLLRFRSYSHDALQLTLIKGIKYQIRVYFYLSVPEFVITPALSFRLNF
jgi:hypothetical protein